MRSRKAAWLLAKELRELAASRAYWLLLVIIGPLAGHAFITAVDLYAEASGIEGGAAALAQGISPLDGILVPTFGAYDLALTLLFPFVAIRLIAAERDSGAWKLMLEAPVRLTTVLAVKIAALAGGWLVAWSAGLIAVWLWISYGGHVYGPELGNLLFGHALRVIMGIGIAFAAVAVTNGAASAAIVTLGFTVGTWALDFIAAGRGGLIEKLASYTPTAALRSFEQGLLSWHIVAAMAATGAAGLFLAAIWLSPSRSAVWRLASTAGVAAALVMIGLAPFRWEADLSENQRNSFSAGTAAALRGIREPLEVTIHLAAEDPRLMDFERNILAKLRRTVPRVEVTYAARGRSGLFEPGGDHYGEIWYQIEGRNVMSRSTTEPIVVETILKLAGIAPVAESGDAAARGYPLAARPAGAGLIFYVLWPLAVNGAWWLHFAFRSRL